MPLLRRVSVLAASIEATSGAVETLDATDAALNVYDVQFSQNISTEERPGQGAFSHSAQVPGLYAAQVSFKTEIAGDGAAGVPGWASTFLPACGWVNSGGTFSPKSEAPGSNVKTLTINFYVNGRRQQMRGCAGTFQIMLPTGRLGMIQWTFTGVSQATADASILAPTYPTVMPMRAVAESFTWGSWTPKVEMVTIDAGNEVILRENAAQSDGSGLAAGLVTARRPTIVINPEAELVATADPWGDFKARTERAFTYEIDNGTDRFVVAAPKAQVIAISEGDRGNMLIDDLTLQCNKSAAAGNDELTFQFAATD